jgi:hypothetical protein
VTQKRTEDYFFTLLPSTRLALNIISNEQDDGILWKKFRIHDVIEFSIDTVTKIEI